MRKLKNSHEQRFFIKIFLLFFVTQLIMLPWQDVTAASPGEIDPQHFGIYADISPVLAVDQANNTFIAWVDFHSNNPWRVLMQKMRITGKPAWVNNIVALTSQTKPKSLSLDTDARGNLFISWIAAKNMYQDTLFLQKFNPEGDTLWNNPVEVLTVKDGYAGNVIRSISDVQIDNRGNAFYIATKRDPYTEGVHLISQVVNSEGFVLSKEGKELPLGLMTPDPYFSVDLALNKKQSIAYIAWISPSPDQSFKEINLQKMTYDSNFLWSRPYHLEIDPSSSLIEFPGIEIDPRENISISSVTALRKTDAQLIFNIHRINKNAQTLWTWKDTATSAPPHLLTEIGFAVDRFSQAYFLVNTRYEVTLYQYRPSGDLEHPSKNTGDREIILLKSPTKLGKSTQGNTARGSIKSIHGGNISISWNQYSAYFIENAQKEHILSHTSDEHIFFKVISPQRRSILPTRQIDTVQTNQSLLPAGGVSLPKASENKQSPSLNTNQDSDHDGLRDTDETAYYKTDPYKPDTDGDGYLDGEEVQHNYNPLGICKIKMYETNGKLYAYGLPRLKDKSNEACFAQYLRKELELFLQQNELNRALSTFDIYLNAFIYGEYPIPSLISHIQGNPSAIHPLLPWRAVSR